MAPPHIRAGAGSVRPGTVRDRIQRSAGASDRLSSCAGNPRRGDRLDARDAAVGVRKTPDAGPVWPLRRRVSRAARSSAGRDEAVFLSVQTDIVLGPTCLKVRVTEF